MTIRYIALIDQTGRVPYAQLESVANALQIQANRDFSKEWNVAANVVALGTGQALPDGYWPIYVKNTIELQNAWGFHWIDDAGVPYAEILYRDNWTLTASHELLEMLVNPYLTKYQVTDIVPEIKGDETFLVEVVGPVQDLKYAYRINSVIVSNFFYPAYFDLIKVSGKKYDHLGFIEQPRSILEGGYVSFIDNLGEWWQAFGVQNKVDLRRLTSDENKQPVFDRILRTVVSAAGTALLVFFTLKFIQKNGTKHK